MAIHLVALKCPSCASPFRDSDFDAARSILTCSYCGASMIAYDPDAPSDSAASKPRVEVRLPPRISVRKSGQGLEIVRRWFQPLHVVLLFFCIAWDSFLAFWYFALSSQNSSPWIAWAFPIAHVALGIALSYYTLAGFVNRTTIVVGKRELRIAHGPLPWSGGLTLATSDIVQLFCKRNEHRSNGGVQFTYDVMVVERNRGARKLLRRLFDEDQALYIEQEVERALGIVDRPTPGELPR